MVSPSIAKLTLARVNTPTSVSLTRLISSELNPNPVKIFDPISAVVPKSISPANDIASVPGIAFLICSGLKPAIA